MDYLDTLQYKNKRVVDSTGYPQNERLFIKSSLDYITPSKLSQSTVVFGDRDDGNNVTVYVTDAVSPNEPVIKPVTKGGGNANLAINGRGAGTVIIDNNKTNYLVVSGSDINGAGVTLSANSNTTTDIDFTLKPKGTGSVKTSSSTTNYLQLDANSINAKASSDPVFNLQAKGPSGRVVLSNGGTDNIAFFPGNGIDEIQGLSTQTNTNINLLPQNNGVIKTTKKVTIVGATPNDATLQLKVANTTTVKTCSILTRAVGAAPYIALDVQGVVGRSIGMESDGRINIKDSILYNAGTILFSIMPSGRVYTPKTFQSGIITTNAATGSATFPTAFASTPMVVVTIENNQYASNVVNVLINNVSTTGFSWEKLYQPIGGGAYGNAANEWLYWTAMINTQ